MNQSVLQELLGKTVEVTSLGSDTRYLDTGTLAAYDEQWIKLVKDSGETLYFPNNNIRILKVWS